ncbi:MAG: hypothetical protein KC466_11930, partial [Myxococcales bacterium]|nr:hypothetical protein [Myxococcales bacterium]
RVLPGAPISTGLACPRTGPNLGIPGVDDNCNGAPDLRGAVAGGWTARGGGGVVLAAFAFLAIASRRRRRL